MVVKKTRHSIIKFRPGVDQTALNNLHVRYTHNARFHTAVPRKAITLHLSLTNVERVHSLYYLWKYIMSHRAFFGEPGNGSGHDPATDAITIIILIIIVCPVARHDRRKMREVQR